MKARSSARLKTGSEFAIELEDADVRQEYPDWDEKKATQRYRILAGRADLYVLDYLYQHNEFSQEFFEQRVREVKERMQ